MHGQYKRPLKEVLADLINDTHYGKPENHTKEAERLITVHDKPKDDLLEIAWGIIANAFWGDWDKAPEEWQKAAKKWRDNYFEVNNNE